MPVTAALIGAGVSTVNIGTGIYDRVKANRELKKLGNSPYYQNETYDKMLGQAANLASSTRMPGQTGTEARIDQNLANASLGIDRFSNSGSAGISGIVAANANAMQANQNLGIAAAQNYYDRQNAYTNAMGQYAAYKDKQFEQNQLFPWQSKMQNIMQIGAAGNQKISQGLSGLASTGAAYAGSKQMDSYIKALAGNADTSVPKRTVDQTANSPIKPIGPSLLPQPQGGIVTKTIPALNTSKTPSTPSIDNFGYQTGIETSPGYNRWADVKQPYETPPVPSISLLNTTGTSRSAVTPPMNSFGAEVPQSFVEAPSLIGTSANKATPGSNVFGTEVPQSKNIYTWGETFPMDYSFSGSIKNQGLSMDNWNSPSFYSGNSGSPFFPRQNNPSIGSSFTPSPISLKSMYDFRGRYENPTSSIPIPNFNF